jgi:hypothetical protein
MTSSTHLLTPSILLSSAVTQPIHVLEMVMHVLEIILEQLDAALLMEHVALWVFIASAKNVWLIPKEERALLPPIVILV